MSLPSILALVLGAGGWLVTAAAPAFATPPDTLWTRFFGPGTCYHAVELPAGGYIATGTGWPDLNGNPQTRLVRLDAGGGLVWEKYYWGTINYAYGFGRRVFLNPDGGFLVVATENRPFSRAYRLITTNSLGDTLWTRLHDDGGSHEYFVEDALRQADGSVVLLGGSYETILTGFSPAGERQWERVFSLGFSTEANGLDRTDDGGFILAGGFRDEPGPEYEGFLIRTDSTGIQQWTREYRLPDYDSIEAVRSLPGGGFLFTGRSDIHGGLWLARTDAAGDTLWSKGGADIIGRDLHLLSDGFLLMSTGPDYFGDLDLAKYDFQGNRIWNRYVGTIVRDEGLRLEPTADGGYVAAGYGKYFGCSFSSCDLDDFWVVRFAPPAASAVPESPAVPRPRLAVYPNPTAGPLVARFGLDVPSSVSATLFDAGGRRILEREFGMRPAGEQSVSLDATGLVPGAYWLRVEAGGVARTARVTIHR